MQNQRVWSRKIYFGERGGGGSRWHQAICFRRDSGILVFTETIKKKLARVAEMQHQSEGSRRESKRLSRPGSPRLNQCQVNLESKNCPKGLAGRKSCKQEAAIKGERMTPALIQSLLSIDTIQCFFISLVEQHQKNYGPRYFEKCEDLLPSQSLASDYMAIFQCLHLCQDKGLNK